MQEQPKGTGRTPPLILILVAGICILLWALWSRKTESTIRTESTPGRKSAVSDSSASRTAQHQPASDEKLKDSERASDRDPMDSPVAPSRTTEDASQAAVLKPAFAGESTNLKQTDVLPTLDSPLVPGKNLIWCSSFQIAWNHMKDNVVKAPILIQNAEETARRLNEADQSEADLDVASFYATAGRAEEVVERIRRDMKAKFPNISPALPKITPGTLVAYAFLASQVRFEFPFFENNRSFLFKDASGAETEVSSFGLRDEDTDAFDATRAQVELLFAESVAENGSPGSFALDLCRTSTPSQLILAMVSPKETLAETLSDLDARIAKGRPVGEARTLKMDAILLVPNILFDLSHQFRELEGSDKRLLNPSMKGNYVQTAWQGVQFRLDRFGASVRSEAKIVYAAKVQPKRFIFDRPFLLIMKKRGARHPFLVMWLENAELLCKP